MENIKKNKGMSSLDALNSFTKKYEIFLNNEGIKEIGCFKSLEEVRESLMITMYISSNLKEIQNSGDFYDRSVQESKDKEIHVSDTHADLLAFLGPGIKSGAFIFKKNEDPFVFYNTKTKKMISVDDIETDVNTDNSIKNIICLPNVEINKDFKGKIIYAGDFIDRGKQSEESFYLVYNLLNQNHYVNDEEEKVIFQTGNHEISLSQGKLSNKTKIGYDTFLYNREEKKLNNEKYEILSNDCLELIKENKLQHYYLLEKGAIISSHSICREEDVELIYNKSNDIIDALKDNKTFIEIFKDEELKNKIFSGEELSVEEQKKFVFFMNTFLNKALTIINQKEVLHNTDEKKHNEYKEQATKYDSLFSTDVKEGDKYHIDDRVEGISQIIGHTRNNRFINIHKNNEKVLILADVSRSHKFSDTKGSLTSKIAYITFSKNQNDKIETEYILYPVSINPSPDKMELDEEFIESFTKGEIKSDIVRDVVYNNQNELTHNYIGNLSQLNSLKRTPSFINIIKQSKLTHGELIEHKSQFMQNNLPNIKKIRLR